MRSRRNPWLFILLILVGALAGGLTGEALSRHPYFAWMSFGGINGYKELLAFSFDPAIDVGIIRFGANFSLKINAGGVIGMILGLLIFLRL